MSAPSRIVASLLLAAGLAAQAQAEGSGRSLVQSLDAVLAGGDLRGVNLGIRVVDSDTGLIVYDRRGDLALKPASSMKVMTSAASLAILRPEYIFTTEFNVTVPPVNGVVRGDLIIKGNGSPGLTGEQWWLMAREIKARGITRIEGDLVGDDTWFDGQERPAGWPSASEDAFYNAPVSALSADFNAITIVVRPTDVGHSPEVFLTPFASFFKIVNRAVTRPGNSNLRVARQYDGGQNTIVVDGSISSRSAPSISYRCVEQPTLYALASFREAAGKEGITISGISRRGVAPAGAVKIYEHESRPLSELTRTMNKLSNNYMAESFLKTLGAETAGAPGSTSSGSASVLSYLETIGVDTRPLVLRDGSGLSHENRLTASSLAAVLVAMYRDFEVYPEFMSSLAIGGVDGTLDRRMVGGSAQRRIRGKTGHLNGVSSLAGYAYTRQGRILAFAILANANGAGDVWNVRRGIDRLCSAMVDSELPGPGSAGAGPQPASR